MPGCSGKALSHCQSAGGQHMLPPVPGLAGGGQGAERALLELCIADGSPVSRIKRDRLRREKEGL